MVGLMKTRDFIKDNFVLFVITCLLLATLFGRNNLLSVAWVWFQDRGVCGMPSQDHSLLQFRQHAHGDESPGHDSLHSLVTRRVCEDRSLEGGRVCCLSVIEWELALN